MNWRKLLAEGLGTMLLVIAVVGSGIMAERLSAGKGAVALLANAIATGAALCVLIRIFAPLSGAQFNPAVGLWLSFSKQQSFATTANFGMAQVLGGMLGAVLANLMFDLPAWQISGTARGGAGQWLGEFIATFGLILTIAAVRRDRPEAIATSVALYITAAYWFTSSTSFANPAVTVARMFSDTFAGISPASVLPFIVAQLAGMATAIGAWRLLDGPGTR
jgi:glycerol uptake facilitator-like aquaporin